MTKRDETNSLKNWLLMIPAVVGGCVSAVLFGAGAMLKWAAMATFSKGNKRV